MNEQGTDPNPTHTLATLTTMEDELTAHPPGGTAVLPMNGTMVPVNTVTGELGGFAATYQKVVDTELAYRLALQARYGIEPEALALIAAVVAALKAIYGAQSPALEPYAVVPEKPRTPLTTDQQAEANAKVKATRKARGTLGPKAKLAIKGTPAAAAAPVAAAPVAAAATKATP